MNLLQDPWLPVRDAEGQRHWIAPDRLTEPQWRTFDANRPDFNGALAQFVIGLLQTTTPVADALQWTALYKSPPDAATLREWFAPVAAAFELEGDGPRFMQDRFLCASANDDQSEDVGALEGIQQLLIDCAGEGEKAKDNTDLFVKRKASNFGLCTRCCAAALYALQSGAPGGGRGYLVSIRGGGPLTTLVWPSSQPLWRALWMNVLPSAHFDALSGVTDRSDLRHTFPWLDNLRFLQPAGIAARYFEGPKGGPKPSEEERPRLQPPKVTATHVYWGMPRRIKLIEATDHGNCHVCGAGPIPLVHRYLTKNYGLNYKGDWSHPLSPYYRSKDGWLPVHPQPGGLGFRHWLAWVLGASNADGSTRPATVVDRALTLPGRVTGGTLGLWAFGYDMDNMKARCWYESTLPLYALADCDRDARAQVQAEVGRWVEAAALASEYLLGAVKDAWFGSNPRGKLEHVKASYWSTTEPTFYRQLQALIESVRTGAEHPPLPVRESWHRLLVRTALRLFDEDFVGAGAVERQNPRRIAQAHRQLRAKLHGPKLRQALGLPVDNPAKPARKRAAGTPRETA
jgi:CRISPR system Cascade subunit CasA